MNKKLWEASKQLKDNSNLFKFEKFISNKYNKNFSKDFEKIHKWSVSDSHNFWNSVWDFTSVKGAKNNQKPKKSSKFYKNIFLPKSKLNFTENLLPKNNSDKAITFISENGYRETKNWKNFNSNVKNISSFLKKIKNKI